MSILKWASGRAARPALAIRARRGWIGIDLGMQSVKLAQVERRGSEYRISARWNWNYAAPSEAAQPDAFSDAMKSELPKLKSLKRLFTGRNCAAALPMALVEHRLFEIPKGTIEEQKRMTGEELAAELGVEPQDLAYDSWECPNGVSTEVARMAVNSVPKMLAQQLGNQLLSSGLECQVLDGTPCALARAVEIGGWEMDGQAAVAIDLSHTLPLVVLVKDGRPLFARSLRGVGMQALMQPLQATLAISAEECQQLLAFYGLTAIGQPPTLASGKTMQIIAHPLQDLLAEIKRTVDYINDNFRASKPRQVCLFGGGTLIKNLPEHIGSKLQIPVALWTLNRNNADPSDAAFGLAAGLSALAWEDSVCL